MNFINKTTLAAAGLIAAMGTNAVNADPTLQFDVNDLTGAVTGPFSTSYTGDLDLSDDANSSVLLFINGGFTGYFSGPGAFDFDGTISFNNGQVTGGHFTITDGGTGDFYTATVAPVGFIFIPVSNGPFKVDGFTFDGTFSGPSFDSVDVSEFFGTEIRGTFSEILVGPFNDGGLDDKTDIDIFGTVVPTPTAALAIVPMLGAMAARRRRR